MLTLLSGCAELQQLFKGSAKTPPPPNYDQLLLDGVYELAEDDVGDKLEGLTETGPESRQADAAQRLLDIHARSESPTSPDKALVVELEKMRLENQRLHEDMEMLRKLLIKSEKTAP